MRNVSILPVAGGALWCCVAIVVNWVQQTGLDSIVRTLEIVESGIEWQSSAHPQEHAGAQTIARCPEIVFTVASILQVLCHRLYLLFRFERRQLQAQRPTVLVGEEIVELRRVGVHSADEILYAVQLNRCNSLPYHRCEK